MKIVGISDIHGNLNIDIPKCDVVCCCGDIMPLYIQNDAVRSTLWVIRDFNDWVNGLECDKFILIGGNHDRLFEHYDPKSILSNDKIVYLQDESYDYKNRVFYGSPWCPDLSQWSFYKSSQELVEAFNKIPFQVDVLLTHCPPKYNQCGVVLEPGWNFGKYFGCQELAESIQSKNISWHLFGHVHSGNHNIEYRNNFRNNLMVNVSVLNEEYKLNYKPFEFEI